MREPASHGTGLFPEHPGGEAAGRPAEEGVFAGAVTTLFLVVGVMGVLHHELWRDEMHAWLLARDSSSLSHVFQVTRYEVHFVLWRVILYGLTRWTHNPMAMQLVSLLAGAGAVWIVARFSPFRRWEKLLFGFGYYSLYEYCIVAQDYNLIVVLMFSACALYRRRTRSYLGLTMVLSLMANTAPYGFVIALVFSALLVFEWFFNKEGGRSRVASSRNLWASGLILLGGYAAAGVQLAMMKESPSTTWKPMLSLAALPDTIANIWRAYVPIPGGFPYWTRLSWGTNFIFKIVPHPLGIAVGLAIVCFVISIGLLLRKPAAMFLYVAGTGALLGVQYVFSPGALRHTGFLFLLFVACLWIGEESGAWEASEDRLRRWGDSFGRWRRPFMAGLLVVQLAAGADIFGADWVYPFSSSKPAAQFIRDRGLSHLVIVGAEEAKVAPLSGYLDRQVYYPDSSRFGSYIDYSRPINKTSGAQVLKKALEFAIQSHREVVLVLSEPLLVGNGAWTPLTEQRVWTDGALGSLSEPYLSPSGRIRNATNYPSMAGENYHLYVLREE